LVSAIDCALAFSRISADDPATRAAQAMELAYRALARRVGLDLGPGEPTAPHDLLATRRWMMVVPRSRERFEGVSVNALGFAGSLLVRDREQLEVVRRHGPLAVLQGIDGTASSSRGGTSPAPPGRGVGVGFDGDATAWILQRVSQSPLRRVPQAV
jgi:ATP adenylyltransferase/5',5'''-P-1,P-4-tetraphosphate phosphorylase II